MTPDGAQRALRLLYAINGAAAAAAAVVLVVAPGAIPATVGIAVTPSANLLAYLLAAAELAIAAMCMLAIKSSHRVIDVQTVTVLIIFHLSSAVGGLMIVSAGESPLILWNAFARIVVVAALLGCARISLRG